MSHGRVLLVDDDEHIGPAVRALLARAGFACHLCVSAAEAKQAARAAVYDFALIDLYLSDSGVPDGEVLYDELEHDHPGMEMRMFTSRVEEVRPTTRPAFEILKYDIHAQDIRTIEAAVLRGVNGGLQKRLAWQAKVADSANMRVAVLDETGRVVWETGANALRPIAELLAPGDEPGAASALHQAVRNGADFNDLVEYPPGRWQTCELAPLPAAAADPGGASAVYRLLTARDSTRPSKAGQLARDFLQYETFDEIAQRICAGLIDMDFCRARLWILQGDHHTLTLYAERGHGLTPDERNLCFFNYPTIPRFAALLANGEAEPGVVLDPTEYLPADVAAILHIRPHHQTLAIRLRVRGELIGLLTVDKVGPGCRDQRITLADRLIGRQIGGLAAAALDRGIHEWQFKRVQSILSEMQASNPDDRLDAIYKPVLDRVIASLGNDPKAPWLPKFQGAEIAVRASRFDRGDQFRRIYVTEQEKDLFPEVVDIREGLIGSVMEAVKGAPPGGRVSAPRHFRNIFSNAAFREQYLRLVADRGKLHPYAQYLSHNLSKTMIPLLDLDEEVLGFLCFHAPCKTPPKPDEEEHPEKYITALHRRWLEVLGQLCSRILEIRERHGHSVAMSNELYKQMTANQAMAEFGERSASVTHEIRQYFQRLLNGVDLLKLDLRRPGKDPLTRADAIAAEVLSGSARLTTLNELFRGISKRDRATVGVAEAIDKTLELTAKGVQEAGVACAPDLPAGLPPLPMSLDQALLVFGNLIRNACDSIRGCGQPHGRVEVRAAWAAPRLTVTVADNGSGIAPENVPRLFQLGFTTKPGLRGMGVGLSLVRRVVEDHGGTIAVDPRPPGEGACFRLVFTLPTPPEGT